MKRHGPTVAITNAIVWRSGRSEDLPARGRGIPAVTHAKGLADSPRASGAAASVVEIPSFLSAGIWEGIVAVLETLSRKTSDFPVGECSRPGGGPLPHGFQGPPGAGVVRRALNRLPQLFQGGIELAVFSQQLSQMGACFGELRLASDGRAEYRLARLLHALRLNPV